jgi:uncharacterized protein (TIGR00255 family)
MSVYSMTGYATGQMSTATRQFATVENSAPSGHLGVEIRSVNSRFLDLSLRLPDELRQSEPALRELLTSHLKRGKVELRVWLDASAGTALRPPSPETLMRVAAVEKSVQSRLPKAAGLSVADVIKMAANEDVMPTDHSQQLVELTRQTLKDLLAAREREGARLGAMLQDRTAQLRQLAALAAPLIPKLVAQQRARFLDRWKDAMASVEGKLSPEVAQERALIEATTFAIRIDVAEELTRLASHLDEIDRLLAKGGELGKRLDFLIQELHREANTLGAKSPAIDLTHISVDMKVLIEQIREQVQNVE